jgi:predicted RNA binding protein YcfA (HicA-like mRNA interferase family)
MPKRPVVSGAQVIRALKRLGFRQVRQRGSHVVMRKGHSGCTVPVPREVRAGTLATILRQAGVQPGAFSAAVD